MVMKRKNKRILGSLALAMILLICSCDGNKIGVEKQPGTDGSETAEFHFLTEERTSDDANPSDAAESFEEEYQSEREITFGRQLEEWNDNYLDDYHAVLNHPLNKIIVEGDLSGAGGVFVGETGCLRNGIHLFTDYRKGWNGVNGITTDGREFEARIVVDPERVGSQIRDLEPISGKRGYVACFVGYEDGKPSEYWFYELDDAFQVKRSVQAKMEGGRQLDRLMGDGDGNFHVLCSKGAKKSYVIVSAEGDVIFEKEVSAISEFRAFGGGRVALYESANQFQDLQLREADISSGELMELSAVNDNVIKEKLSSYVYDITPIDDYRVAWCTSEGILTYDSTSKETKVVYRWSNHGIVPARMYDMNVMNDGSIAILTTDENEDGLFYMLLEPTKEKRGLKTITFAVNANSREKFEKAAAFFQRKYPSYVIQIKDDYDETYLLTQLGAGKGPVLVDTSVTGFEELEKLWQPLDGFLEQAGLMDEIIPETLELGKIGGVTYGIVRDFQIDTLLVSNAGPKDWDYEGFLTALENHDGALLTMRYIDYPDDRRFKFFDMLSNDLSDNCYLNAETGTAIFGTATFERVLRLSQKALKCPPAEEGKALREGLALCECDTEYTIETVIRLRQRLENNGELAIGYPTNDGARHRLVGISPIAIRRSATQEEKEIAYTFLKVYLSREAMESDGGFIPIRKDVLESRYKRYQDTVNNDKETGNYNPDNQPELDWDKDIQFLEGLIQNSVAKKEFPAGLQRIFDEEFGDYLDGRIDGKMLDNHLKNRVGLYLKENK